MTNTLLQTRQTIYCKHSSTWWYHGKKYTWVWWAICTIIHVCEGKRGKVPSLIPILP